MSSGCRWPEAALGTDRSSFLLAKGLLAGGVRHEGQGLSDTIGCRGLLVHAESEQARSFYEHLIPEFERSPTDPLHLLLLLQDIRRTLTDGRPPRSGTGESVL